MTNERKCKLVKITATSKLGEPLTDKRTYLLDENTMTVYAPWAHVEMLHALNLQIEELSEGEKG